MSLVRCLLIAAGAALTATTPAGYAAELSPIEQRIVAAVKERSPAALQFLERTVNVNSGTMNFAGVRETGRLFGEELSELGFTTRWAEMPPAMQRAGHLVATRGPATGAQGKRLLLIGHLDTVFEADSPVQRWNRQGDRVRGQGVSDMKGGNVIVLEALRALQRVGALENTRIAVAFSGDEERAGEPIAVARADMIELARLSDMALAFEGAVTEGGRATATIGRRASGGWRLQVSGKQGHSAGVFSASAGYGAIYEAARILNTFRDQLIEPDLTFNVGLMVGGTETTIDDLLSKGTAFGKGNVIANTATARGDLRYLTAEQRDRVQARMRAIVAASLPGTSAKISFTETYPPMSPTAGNLALLQLYSQASSDAGLGRVEALPPGQRGAGDVQFVAPLVDSLDGLGASGRGSHSPDEDLELASIERGAIRAALLIYRLTR